MRHQHQHAHVLIRSEINNTVSELEEKITDPASHAVLKTMAQEKNLPTERLSEKTGISEGRLRDIVSDLSSEGFLDREAGSVSFQDHHLEKLNSLTKETEYDVDHSEDLREIRQEIDELEGKGFLTQEKDREYAAEVIDQALATDGDEGKALRLRAARILSDADHPHEKHPFRGHKLRKKVGEIESEYSEGSGDSSRGFFGNRWTAGSN